MSDFDLSVLVVLGDPPPSDECVGAGEGGVGVEEVMPKEGEVVGPV